MGVMCVTCGGWPGGLCDVSSWYECYVCHMWGVAGWSVCV